MSSDLKVRHARDHKRKIPVNVGDIVGLSVAIISRDGEEVDRKVMVTGTVTRIWTAGHGKWYRADVKVRPQDKARWFLYSGKDGWAWLRDLTLVKRAPKRGR